LIRASVRGIGAVTPFGGLADALGALAAGRTAVRPIDRFDATRFPCTVAAPVDRWLDAEDRRVPMALEAARIAWEDADIRAPGRVGVFVGAESGRASFATVRGLARAAGGGRAFDHAAFGVHGRDYATRIDAAVVSPAAVAAALAGEFAASGPVETFSLACASGLAAIVEAVRAIRLGIVDVAVAGGVGADVDPLMIAGFGRLGALSARGASRPFDRRRDGFVVGEGAAFAILAAGDGRARVAGVARTLDACHLTMPDPAGDGAFRAMSTALADAGLDAVDAIQAHGTSTPQNDAVEAAAIARLLGNGVPVSSIKGAVGHWIAGAGAIGFLAAVHAVEHGVILPTAGLAEPDPRCAVRHVVGEALVRPVRSALVNAFAFGGANACAVVVA
jgi:3-oxoacyl-[acyl-carrier-protein] synthase II